MCPWRGHYLHTPHHLDAGNAEAGAPIQMQATQAASPPGTGFIGAVNHAQQTFTSRHTSNDTQRFHKDTPEGPARVHLPTFDTSPKKTDDDVRRYIIVEHR